MSIDFLLMFLAIQTCRHYYMNNKKNKTNMHRVYKLHPHKHTGKLIHHRHTSYPVLVALIVIVGILIGLTGRIASADDLLVTATVPAPIPVGAPVFTSPEDGTVTEDPSVTFEGTCPIITPAVIIALYEGPTLLGSGICEASGTFEVTASLTPGAHTIAATVVTITGDNGESSQPLHITYTPKAPPVALTNPSTPSNPKDPTTGSGPIPDASALAPLDIVSDKPFVTFSAELKATWRASFRGGQAPYRVTIAWGDGTVDTQAVTSSEFQTFTHTYKANRLYTLSVTLKDQSGLSLTRYYVAMRNNGAPVSSTSTSFATYIDSPIINQFWALWTIYLCLLLMLLLMWRYEHAHYPKGLVGVPLHYPWQKAKRSTRPSLKH